jgi:hypothetical protein
MTTGAASGLWIQSTDISFDRGATGEQTGSWCVNHFPVLSHWPSLSNGRCTAWSASFTKTANGLTGAGLLVHLNHSFWAVPARQRYLVALGTMFPNWMLPTKSIPPVWENPSILMRQPPRVAFNNGDSGTRAARSRPIQNVNHGVDGVLNGLILFHQYPFLLVVVLDGETSSEESLLLSSRDSTYSCTGELLTLSYLIPHYSMHR